MSLENLIIAKLKSLNKQFKKSGDHYIISQCLNPKHKDTHPSFSINLKTGSGFCFTCDYKVNKSFWINENDDNQYEIIRESQYNLLREKLKKEKQEKKTFILPPRNAEVKEGWRGLNKETIEKYKLYITYYGLYKNRVIFPFYENSELVGFNSRALYSDMQPKYLYAKGMDLKSIIYPDFDYADTLIIVEGVMDALSLIQNGIPAIANLGLALNFNETKIQKLLSKGVTKLYFMFDNDKAGKEAYKKFFQSKLKNYFNLDYAYKDKRLIDFYKSGCKDYNEFLQKKNDLSI